MRTLLTVLALFACSVRAQFFDLAPDFTGSSVYFTSTLKLRNTLDAPVNAKLYRVTPEGVTLIRSRERAPLPTSAPFCEILGFDGFSAIELSRNDTVSLQYNAYAGGCSYPMRSVRTLLIRGEQQQPQVDVPEDVRLSSDGKAAIHVEAVVYRPFVPLRAEYVDLTTGDRRPVTLPFTGARESTVFPLRGGRIIANDGTAVFAATTSGGSFGADVSFRGVLLKPDGTTQPFPVSGAAPLFISADAAKILFYDGRGLSILDAQNATSAFLTEVRNLRTEYSASDDLRRILITEKGEVRVIDTTTATVRTIFTEGGAIQRAAISGNGVFAFAVTDNGRMLRMGLDNGEIVEWLPETPYLNLAGDLNPGLSGALSGVGLTDHDVAASAPFPTSLDGATLFIGNRKVALTKLTPQSVAFISPWDPESVPWMNNRDLTRVRLELPSTYSTPFAMPEGDITFVGQQYPQTGAVLRQDWTQTYVGPVSTGEVIHVYALGFGPTTPEAAPGAPAPASEPFARISELFRCTNAEVLYAGLAPFAVERIYQIDLRIGPQAGYQQFTCTLGKKNFIFLTLLVKAD